MQPDLSDKTSRPPNPWRRLGIRVLDGYARLLLATTALSGATLIFPQAVSRSYEDYTQGNPRLADCRQDFNASNLRVYRRLNPLVPFHEAGVVAQNYFREGRPFKGVRALVGNPFVAFYAMAGNYGAEHDYPGLNAFSLSTGGDLGSRTSYIYPTKLDIEPEDILRVHGFHVPDKLQFKADHAAVKRLLHDWIFLHEARHGDQSPSDMDGSTREADADVYALQLMKAHEGDTAAYAEARDFILHLRTISGMEEQASRLRRIFNPRNANNHMTSLAIGNNAASPETSRMTVRAFGDFLDACDALEMEQSLTAREQWYYAACTLLAEGKLQGNPGAHRVAQEYVTACQYFSRLRGQPDIDRNFTPAAAGGEIKAREYPSRQVIAAAQEQFRIK